MLNNPCRTCRWWVAMPNQLDRADAARIGTCRRSAPRLMEGRDGRQHSNFPQMREDGFCGQWRAVPQTDLTEEVSDHG